MQENRACKRWEKMFPCGAEYGLTRPQSPTAFKVERAVQAETSIVFLDGQPLSRADVIRLRRLEARHELEVRLNRLGGALHLREPPFYTGCKALVLELFLYAFGFKGFHPRLHQTACHDKACEFIAGQEGPIGRCA